MSSRNTIEYGNDFHLFEELQGDDNESDFVRLTLNGVDIKELSTSKNGCCVELKISRTLAKELGILKDTKTDCDNIKEIRTKLLEQQHLNTDRLLSALSSTTGESFVPQKEYDVRYYDGMIAATDYALSLLEPNVQ
jgi:hypothetical protein